MRRSVFVPIDRLDSKVMSDVMFNTPSVKSDSHDQINYGVIAMV